jgi:hypothetical protein
MVVRFNDMLAGEQQEKMNLEAVLKNAEGKLVVLASSRSHSFCGWAAQQSV